MVRTEAGAMVARDRARGERSGPHEAPPGFEQFFRSNYAAVVRIAQRIVGDGALADDVAQDAFIAAERQWRPAAGDTPSAGWVSVAAVHLALNALRGERRRDRRQLRASNGSGEQPALPEDVVLASASRDSVREALGRLPERTAAVLLLRHSGLSYAEVASALEVNVGAVGTMLRRAEAALRKEMERETPT